MIGRHNGLLVNMGIQNPNILGTTCVNHALQLACSYASQELPNMVEKVNLLFQEQSVEPVQLSRTIEGLVLFLRNQVHHADGTQTDVQLDERSTTLLLQLTEPDQNQILEKCTNFISTLLSQVQSRTERNRSIMAKIALINMAFVQPQPDIADLLFDPDLSPIITADKYVLLRQWGQLQDVAGEFFYKEWSDLSFWIDIKAKTLPNGENFSEISDFALKMLSICFSNAGIERIFSEMNSVKTKVRNRMGSALLNAILAIKHALRRENSCCHSFPLMPQALKDIGHMSLYSAPSINNDLDDEECVALMIENARKDKFFFTASQPVL